MSGVPVGRQEIVRAFLRTPRRQVVHPAWRWATTNSRTQTHVVAHLASMRAKIS